MVLAALADIREGEDTLLGMVIAALSDTQGGDNTVDGVAYFGNDAVDGVAYFGNNTVDGVTYFGNDSSDRVFTTLAHVGESDDSFGMLLSTFEHVGSDSFDVVLDTLDHIGNGNNAFGQVFITMSVRSRTLRDSGTDCRSGEEPQSWDEETGWLHIDRLGEWVCDVERS